MLVLFAGYFIHQSQLKRIRQQISAPVKQYPVLHANYIVQLICVYTWLLPLVASQLGAFRFGHLPRWLQLFAGPRLRQQLARPACVDHDRQPHGGRPSELGGS